MDIADTYGSVGWICTINAGATLFTSRFITVTTVLQTDPPHSLSIKRTQRDQFGKYNVFSAQINLVHMQALHHQHAHMPTSALRDKIIPFG